MALTAYEIEVVRHFLATHSPGQSSLVDLNNVLAIKREFNGFGYYCTFDRPESWPDLPKVVSSPIVIGETKEKHQLGFVLFTNTKEIVLECYPYDDQGISMQVLDNPMTIKIAT
jgi:hypothetical protein